MRAAVTPLVVALACGAPDHGAPDIGAPHTTGEPGSTGPGPGGSGETPTTTGDVSTSTTGLVADTSTGATTTGDLEPVCGDGLVEGVEQCDDGAANSDNAFCTIDCVVNFCGDGKLLVGWELCDEGGANSDSYGHLCSANCSPGRRCGDHIVDPEEECDLGPDNGGEVLDEQGIGCDATCDRKALRAFVTSEAFTGELGGILGADQKCLDAAAAAGLPLAYRFHAYLSTPDNPAKDRFPGPGAEPLPYVLISGEKLADSHAKLLDEGPLGEGLSVTEYGDSIYDDYVATNTSPGGGSWSKDQHCLGWQSADPMLKARAGRTYPGDPGAVGAWASNGQWINYLTFNCSANIYHLYCLELWSQE